MAPVYFDNMLRPTRQPVTNHHPGRVSSLAYQKVKRGQSPKENINGVDGHQSGADGKEWSQGGQ